MLILYRRININVLKYISYIWARGRKREDGSASLTLWEIRHTIKKKMIRPLEQTRKPGGKRLFFFDHLMPFSNNFHI